MEQLILNAVVVTVDPQRRVLWDGAVLVRDDRIADIGSTADLKAKYPSPDRTIDAGGKVLFPGFINNHTHLFQTLLKGIGDDMELSDWLSHMMFPAAVYLEPEDTYHAAMLGLSEALHSGVTTTVDYMHCHSKPGLTDGICKAVKDLGVRGIVGRGTMDTGVEYGTCADLCEKVADVEADLHRLFKTYHDTENGRLKIWAAPSSMWSNSDEMLKMQWRVVNEYGSGFTVHISETEYARMATEWVHGCNDVDLLKKLGILGPNVLMVHCCWINDQDIALIKEHDMKVSHDACANMYLADGVAPLPEMLKAGVTVGLGLDGAASNNSQDMIELMKCTALLHKNNKLDPMAITAEKVLEMATIDGARSIGLDNEIGSIEVGKKADLVFFDPAASQKSTPMHNPVSTLVYSSGMQNIVGVMVDGKMLMEDGRLLTASDADIIANGQRTADAICCRGKITNRREGHKWESFKEKKAEN
ncbi:amidohydrolase family protein [Pseudoflavonifractor sp. MSJ-37]|uniref:amidohydrolase family protein n=1 Tax=Pseudoflavonifractor sp. MSJ-37 TaxID=2841531 RepID=UPI001C1236D7|nr:amidohydrolase [Pseudoflavonifractor sp. MSJ-37]MBU5434960.1 amidohydrolase [Pseudoflavonifractor sp. MSJ-37]